MLNDYDAADSSVAWRYDRRDAERSGGAGKSASSDRQISLCESATIAASVLILSRFRTRTEGLYAEWIGELYSDLHAKNLRLYVNVQSQSADDWVMKAIAKNSDGIILMNYDQHEETSDPGPVAAQDWFEGNLARVLKLVPKQKLICGYGQLRLRLGRAAAGKGQEAAATRSATLDDLTRAGGLAARRRCRCRRAPRRRRAESPTSPMTTKTSTCVTRCGSSTASPL